MSAYSKNQQICYKSQSHNLPLLGKMLSKNKKYRYRDQSNQKAMRCDIDTFIHTIVNKENNPCQEKLAKDHFKAMNKHVQARHQHFLKHLEFLPPTNSQTREIKAIRMEMHKYMTKMGKFSQPQSSEYTQFVRLSQQSLDYLEYYLKNHFKEDKDLSILQNSDKKIILSMLKNNFKCLTDNPSEIANRIMLSFGINPLNDFHFIDWSTFSRFRKLALGTQNKLQARNFIVSYFMVNNKQLQKGQFCAIIGGIVRKLQKVMNLSNVQHLIQRIQTYGNIFIPATFTIKDLQQLIVSQHFFIWEELIHLIFIA